MWKYSTTWKKKTLKIGLSTSNFYPKSFVYPGYTLFPIFFFLTPQFYFTNFSWPVSLPCHIVSWYISLYGAHGVLFLSSLFSSSFHFIFMSKLPSYLCSQRKHSLLLSAFVLYLYLPPLLPIWLLLSNQASCSSCLVLAKGKGQSLDREVPFSAQRPF